MLIRLKRFSYSPTETEGVLCLPSGDEFATIERPSIPNPNGAPGGMYELVPFTRPSGEQCWLISNADLGVYKSENHLPKPKHGRFLCLIHIGNWVTDVVGCVAPGLERYPMVNGKTRRLEQAVRSSASAMRELRALLDTDRRHLLSIESVLGASNV